MNTYRNSHSGQIIRVPSTIHGGAWELVPEKKKSTPKKSTPKKSAPKKETKEE